MKLTKFLQQGGQIDPNATPQGGQEQGGGQGGPEEQIAQIAQQLIQNLGPEACGMLVQILAQMLQQAQGQGQQGAPTYQRKGGKLVKVN